MKRSVKKKPAKAEVTYSAELLMRNVAKVLVRDFQTLLDDPSFANDFYRQLQKPGNLAGIRSSVPTPDEGMDVVRFKATYQIASLLKRYRFEQDLYSDDELQRKAVLAFTETQSRIRAASMSEVSAYTASVLDCARVYIAHVLGEYSDEEHRSLCRFGSRASVGVPLHKASLAQRWELPVSGSKAQIDWFDSEMSQVSCVQEYWAKQKGSDLNKSTYQHVEALTMTLVPKSYKSVRAIMPNTTIGTYKTLGLGDMMYYRLRDAGFDIRRLQERHKKLARRGSLHGQYTTADLSAASDSISVALVEKLFPTDWFNVLNSARMGLIKLPDKTYCQMETFGTMGVGYTFPLQTLVFLALLKAILYVSFGRRMRATISVYGDDMIYITSMHPMVTQVFEELGFVLNADKTFSTGHFRESCGGDYFHGVDVRPFQPKNGPAKVGDKAYEALLYKTMNGLLSRWSEHEIPQVLQYLLVEIGKVTEKAKLVPHLHPDDSGIQIPGLPYAYNFLRDRTDVAWPKSIGHGLFRFSWLRLKPNTMEEDRHAPYLWRQLGPDNQPDLHPDWSSRGDSLTPVQQAVVWACGIRDTLETFQRAKAKGLTYRSILYGGKRFPREETRVGKAGPGRYVRQSSVSCFETP